MISRSWMPALRRRAAPMGGGCRWRRWRGGSLSGWRRARTWPRGWPPRRPAGLGDGDLAAVAGSWRRVASWAQARELAAVAQITSRAAARDENAAAGADGCPPVVTRSAAAQVALELTMSPYGASAWADLAVQLGWRLAATGAALAAGTIDLARARLIAEAASPLGDEAARAVEARVLPAAGGQTTGMLRAALRRAVIAADPAGAEERAQGRGAARAVVLYPDQDATATLAGQRLPAVHATAAMARIKAMARALKASGAGRQHRPAVRPGVYRPAARHPPPDPAPPTAHPPTAARRPPRRTRRPPDDPGAGPAARRTTRRTTPGAATMTIPVGRPRPRR